MKKIVFALLGLLVMHTGFGQKKKDPLTPKERQTDSTINADIVWPFVKNVQANSPDWNELGQEVSSRYDGKYAERAVIRGKIFYYFANDWKQFNANLIQYTNNYENKEDAKLMNKNAAMILKYSNDKEDIKQALRWSKLAVDKEPANENFKNTWKSLKEKLGKTK